MRQEAKKSNINCLTFICTDKKRCSTELGYTHSLKRIKSTHVNTYKANKMLAFFINPLNSGGCIATERKTAKTLETCIYGRSNEVSKGYPQSYPQLL
jgi:hypothetical protein